MPKSSKVKRGVASAQKLPNSTYTTADISDELYREILLSNGTTYRIDNPQTLIIRKGGKTHRVVDSVGMAHCYAAPETGNTVIRWVAKPGLARVKF